MNDQSNQKRRSRKDRGVLELIRRIHAGELTYKNLNSRESLQLVEYLTLDGQSVAEIADILKASTRTINRIRADVRKANAIKHDPELTADVAGALAQRAEAAFNRLRRVQRDQSTKAATKVEAERAAWLIYTQMVQLLRTLGLIGSTPGLEHRNGGVGDQAVDLQKFEHEVALIRKVAGLPLKSSPPCATGGFPDALPQRPFSEDICEKPCKEPIKGTQRPPSEADESCQPPVGTDPAERTVTDEIHESLPEAPPPSSARDVPPPDDGRTQ